MDTEIKERIEKLRVGEVPVGYKAELPYVVPSDWSVTRLGDVTIRTSRRNDNDADIPVFSINNQIGFVPQSEQFDGGSYIDMDKTAYKVVLEGEFAYNPARINVGSIGRLKHTDKAIVSSLYVCFKLKGKHDGTYFRNWFDSYSFYKEVIRNLEGSVREYLFYENFSKIRMPLPTIAEQEKIAEILTHCDRLIELKKQLVVEKRRQKKWLMQNLLDPDSDMRLPGFEGSKRNRCKLKLLCSEIIDGDWIESKDQSESGIRLIQTGNIGIGVFADKGERAKYISEDTFKRLNCAEVIAGDVLISRLPDPIGRACIIPKLEGRAITAVDCSILRFKNFREANYFIQYACSEPYFKEITVLSGGSTRIRISRKELENIVIPMPDSDSEQIAITNFFSIAGHEINLLEKEIAQWQAKKKALMQLLLTGLVRVN